ncbi:hypothetical protein VNO77_27254 [Canavalia gladiata]|uniref:Uncharacterized protein n=1 Tax=Canavalia gladiata TaxID=3824 RepID=A0AAN9QAC2_CANGL
MDEVVQNLFFPKIERYGSPTMIKGNIGILDDDRATRAVYSCIVWVAIALQNTNLRSTAQKRTRQVAKVQSGNGCSMHNEGCHAFHALAEVTEDVLRGLLKVTRSCKKAMIDVHAVTISINTQDNGSLHEMGYISYSSNGWVLKYLSYMSMNIGLGQTISFLHSNANLFRAGNKACKPSWYSKCKNLSEAIIDG